MITDEQTYLAKLGFADPDKKNPLHDQCCIYLTQPDKLTKLAKLMIGDDVELRNVNYRVSRHVLKRPNYGTHHDVIGYLDVVLEAEETKNGYVLQHRVVIEVKASPITTIPAVIQQIGTYFHYLNESSEISTSRVFQFVLCTMYSISDFEKKMLADRGIRHIFVRPEDVTNFIKEQSQVITIDPGF